MTIPISLCRWLGRSRREKWNAASPSAAAASARRFARTRVPGIRAALIHDHFSARQGVEDDHMNILCMGGRTVGPAVAWDLVQTFLAAEYSQAERHLRRLGKVAPWKQNRNEQSTKGRSMTNEQLEQLAINTIRTLSMDAVQQANSGHPGTPMALAPLVYTLWNRVLRFDPQDPIWPNRDRFVLSNGHASMLLWSRAPPDRTQAVDADYERLGEPSVTLDDIRRFRQLGSKAPGHPEYHWVSGVETTTGPLGPGRRHQRRHGHRRRSGSPHRYNRPGFDIFDYNIYAVCGDGCMMEGVASEAASLAGHLGLDNLCWIYDNNHITIEGNTRIAFTEDVAARFLGYGWNVLRVGDANDIDRIEHASGRLPADARAGRRFIILDSHIGYGSPHKQDTAAAHGEPLGEEEVRLDQARLRLARGREVPRARRRLRALRSRHRRARRRGAAAVDGALRRLPRQVPRTGDRDRPDAAARAAGRVGPQPAGLPGRRQRALPGRDASGKVLNVLAQNIPWLLGGSADLGPSNKTTLTFEGAGDFQADTPGGRNLHFGIREHAMAAIVNGLSLSKLRAFGATFFIFSDYARPAIRLSALMELPSHLRLHARCHGRRRGRPDPPAGGAAGLACVPSRDWWCCGPATPTRWWRPTAYIMQLRHEPAVLVLSRQPLPTLDRSKYAPAAGRRARRLRAGRCSRRQAGGDPHRHGQRGQSSPSRPTRQLLAEGIRSRVVSHAVLGHLRAPDRRSTARACCRPTSRPASPWSRPRRLAGSATWATPGRVIGMKTFGASAPLKELQKKFGFEPGHVAAAAKEQLGKKA